MKIAVAYFGIPRNSKICYPSILQNIYAALPERADVESFYHFYRQDRVRNPHSGEDGALDSENYSAFAGMQGVLEPPDECLQRWEFERIKEFGDAWGDDFVSLGNLLRQLNSLYEVVSQVESFAPDFVLFVRPDLLYHDPMPSYIFRFPGLRRDNVYVPNWQWWGGLNDRFAICGRDSYKAYGRRIERIFDFCQATGRPLHSERLLKYALRQARSRVCTLNVRASRVRLDGKVVEELFSSRKKMKRREDRYIHPLSTLRTFMDRFLLIR
ncbi:hypothetical protein SAMN04244573_01083 [Azotobacter beijerinckii]|uniref:Uncharacterized protein n=1 Tax=Azotobacter beijerinckii TaxID=170623 RepID=A0A1H9DP35_9GAMM|nr:hypothetical protein [Azotobacter beijerinckii]SEJ03502.1 hypothetical protein SAMN04244579_02875 [Azotobacter beijerinckii]SEQ15171.1 hypothetical protein SAMN04244573_01083 [Azotobacter beijerinckii]